MRTIHEYARSGIPQLGDLKDALRLAMQLEFATIPPYLCAQWSIKSDPDRVEGILHHIVGQEMNHMALAGNLLSAIGGTPKIAKRTFLPRYPLHALPGGVEQDLPVDLKPLSFEQLEVFLQIEYPEFAPVAALAQTGPATIGEFYDAIIHAFKVIQPKFRKDANRVPVVLSGPILTIADAISVVTRIKVEGEGLQDSPEQPAADGPTHAHYYLFKEIYRQQRLIKTPAGWEYTGSPIAFPDVHNFRKHRKNIPLIKQFRRAVTKLLMDLDGCWRNGEPLNVAGMFQVHLLGRALIQLGVQPEFKWLRPSGV